MLELLDYSILFIPSIYNSPNSLILLFSNKVKEILFEETQKCFNVDIRLKNLPPSFLISSIGNFGINDSDKLIDITGTVILCGSIKSLAFSKIFRCCLCKHEFLLENNISLFNSFELPYSCESGRCRSSNFEEINGSEE